MTEAEKYWLEMRPEINRRLAEGLKKIGENIARHPSPLEAERTAHIATRHAHAKTLQELSASVSLAARNAIGAE